MTPAALVRKYFSKRVDIDNHQGAGAYGRYIKLSSKYGAKILTSASGSSSDFDQCKTIKELKKSRVWKAARKEMECMIKARSLISRKFLIPACYGIAPVKVTLQFPFCHDEYCFDEHKTINCWLPAIFVEHIEGKRLGDQRDYTEDHVEKLEQFLYLHGIKNDDIHDENVMIRHKNSKHKSRLVLIDWTPEYVHFDRHGKSDFI